MTTRAHGATPRRRAGELAESRHELAVRGGRGWFISDRARAPAAPIERTEPAGQAAGDRSGPHDEHIVGGRNARRDRLDEPAEVFEALRFASRLWVTAAAVADVRIVTDVTGRAAMGWHIRRDPF
ncbi:MAG TPA: hypothetical protein VFR14_01245 [Candidatus Limnocylindrales bacterium]|nr:hypothetical protein [Candidatus Limnocylindrales bacterium]